MALGGVAGGTITVPLRAQQSKRFLVSARTNIAVGGTGNSVLWPSGLHSSSLGDLVQLSDTWHQIAIGYDEFRIVKVRLRFVPVNRYSKVSTIVTGPFTLTYDNDSTSSFVPSSERTMLAYQTSRIVSMDDPQEFVYAIPQTSVGVWYDVGTPTSQLGVFVLSNDTLYTSSGNTMVVYYDMEVETRGQRA